MKKVSTGVIWLAFLSIVLSAPVAADTNVNVGRITVSGNEHLSDREIVGVMDQAGRRFFILPKKFDDLQLFSDLREIVALYRRHGYIYAEAFADSLSFHGNKVDIHVEVREETQVFLGSVTLEGDPGVATWKELDKLLEVEPGRPYSSEQIARAQGRILIRLSELGHLFASIDPTLKVRDRTADVEFRILAGPVARYTGSTVEGNAIYRDEAIREEVRIAQGAILDRERIVRARGRLAGREWFRNINVTPVPNVDTWDTAASSVDAKLRLEVNERPPRWVSARAGWGTTDRLFGAVEWGHRNINGYGRSIALDANASATRRGAGLTLKEPWPIPVVSTGRLQIRANDEIHDAFTERKFAAEVGALIPLSPYANTDLSVEMAKKELLDILPNSRSEILAGVTSNPFDVLTVKSVTSRSSYDDPVFPRDGSAGRLTAAVTFLDLESWKVDGQVATVWPVGSRGALAVSGSAGFVENFGNTSAIPSSDRFFLGGPDSLRGFRRDAVGPLDSNGQAIGGRFYVLGQAELRYTVADKGHVAAFFDVGEVFATTSDFDLDSFDYSPGIGLRYHTPFGPIRLDYAWPVRNGEIGAGRVNLAVGYAF